MIEQIVDIDERFFLFLNSINSEYVDPFMFGFSGRFVWIAFYASIVGVMIWRFGWKKGLMLIAAVAVAVGCADFICASVIRPIFARLRPAHLDNPISAFVHIVNEYRGGRYGFPSCHAANTFALTIATSMMLKSRSYFYFMLIWALMQCYSRIYLGVHYPGDIAVGACVGTLMGWLVYKVTAKVSDVAANESAQTWPAIAVGLLTVLAILIFY